MATLTDNVAGHDLVCIAADVKLGKDVRLAKFINLYGCSVGDETKIGTFVEIQKNASVGRRCKISSHTFICEGVIIEDHVFTGHGVTFVNDPRVTPIGSFLRKTSLDELPQLWNVLCGEMSLVGPRPPLSYEVQQYKPWHYRRVIEAKPGITGLWQVTGRSRTTFDDMVRLDLRYARTHSVWTDVKILLATPRAVFSGKGAC